MDNIRKIFENITPLSDSDWQIFSSQLERKRIPKKTILLGKGKTERYLSFMITGTIRLYIPKIDNDLTFGFVFDNQFFSAYDSFLNQTPSEYQIETLSDIDMWRISYNNLQEVYLNSNNGNLIGRKMAEHLFLLKAKRELSLLNKTAEERYLELFSERPILLQQIPLKYIASYIGVTPQALSRIRKRIY